MSNTRYHANRMGPYTSVAFLRDFFILGSFVLQAYDLFASMRAEYRYIWRAPWTLVKCIYIFSRYFGLLSQLVVLVISASAHTPHIPIQTCQLFVMLQVLTFHFLLFALEVILDLRVYALYKKNYVIGFILVIFCTLENTLIAIFWGWYNPILRLPLSSSCVLVGHPHKAASVYANSTLFAHHFSIWCLTIMESWQYLSIRDASGNVLRLVYVLIRDGAFIFFTLTLTCLAALLYSFYVGSAAHVALPLLSCICSIGTCRLILNLQSIRTGSSLTDEVALASCFALTEVPPIEEPISTGSGFNTPALSHIELSPRPES
ncbi:hypothetical protein BDN72DRAFT_89237 [Pluteus cervinus]|uniref:Uncharacterized protein n=1 Tax=Pluteus cervinus TaxID=181527 RepID=A0ACD3APJ5_9AGAR|nr:hypothetical protein BDN72DRAFT_89237 [Pluteus cervinus]